MTIPSQQYPTSMLSLGFAYGLGLTTGTLVNLVSNRAANIKKDVLYSLGAGLGALVITTVWKTTFDDDFSDSSTKKRSINKPIAPLIFSLGMFAGINLGNTDRIILKKAFLTGFGTAGMACVLREDEKEANLQHDELM